MEALEDKIKKFLAIDIGSGDGSGSGDGDGDGYGDGSGSGYGDGDGDGDGYGYGSGDGSGSGDGDGSGYGDGVKEVSGSMVYIVDKTPTIITSVRANVAQGFILQNDLQTSPCYIVKENNKFAHGDTLRDAFMSLHEKLYDDSTEEERIEAFVKKFPSYDTKYDNKDLFAYHHVLTGSCRMGRELFVNSKGLSLGDKTSVREFVELTMDAYGGDVIRKLPKAYGITE